MSETTPLEELKIKALETAQRLVDYRMYGERRTQALAALRRRVVGLEKAMCEAWLAKAIEVHSAAVRFVEDNEEEAFQIYRRDPKRWDFSELGAPFFERFPEFPRDQLLQHLHFLFYIHHLR